MEKKLKVKRKEMRLVFNRSNLKYDLEEMAIRFDLSLNSLVNLLLASHFYESEKNTLMLLEKILSDEK